MNKAYILALYDYHYWANARIFNAATKLSNDIFVARGTLSHGGLRGTLHHTFTADYLWRKRLQEKISLTSIPPETDYPDLAALRSAWNEEEKLMRAFINGLTDETLKENASYKTMKGIPYTNPLWQSLVHVVNHGTQHRAEAAVLLTDNGASPGDVDMLLFFREFNK
jgi:uncharacterized damage-inducible protein DinB